MVGYDAEVVEQVLDAIDEVGVRVELAKYLVLQDSVEAIIEHMRGHGDMAKAFCDPELVRCLVIGFSAGHEVALARVSRGKVVAFK